jgi:hypothetical protein
VGTVADEPLSLAPLTLQPTAAAVALASDGAGFADQRGGGVFVDDQGRAVRLRADASVAALESHPDNHAPPGKVRRVLATGADSAWVVADNGVYVARAGWLYELRAGIDLAAEDVIAAAVSGDDQAFIALRQGLFRVSGDDLAELKRGDESITNVSALAVAPAPSGGPALWFVQDGALHYAEQTANTAYAIHEAGLPAAATGQMLALGGVSAAPNAPGELWLLTPHGLWQHTPARGFRAFVLPAPGSALLSAGRFVWLRCGAELYRYDADHNSWGRLSDPPSSPQLLASDATGSLWLRSDAGSELLAEPGLPRVLGLFEGSRVYAPDLALSVHLAASDAPENVTFALDDGEHVERSVADARSDDADMGGDLIFSLAGFDAAGNVQTYSFAARTAGMHTLTVSARHDDGTTARALHFEMRDTSSQKLSWAKDVQPIYAARCAKCHAGMGPGHLLNSFDLWSAQASAIVAAVTEKRMPADGPLDASQIQLITRWAAAGSAP